MNWLGLLEQCAGAATLLLLAAFAASWALHRAPSAWRHFLWTAVLSGLLTLPVMVRIAPSWRAAPALPATAAAIILTPSGDPTSSVAAGPAYSPVLLVWLAGCMLVAARFLAGWVRAALMVRHAGEAVYARGLIDAMGGRGVRVVQSVEARTALAARILRPAVVLPPDADAWPVERLRAALLHEWMHVKRRDLLAQAVAQAACCLYWFHPLVWVAAARLRREREQACDDAVLGRGIAARDYAGHLVDSARALRGQRSSAVAMAEPSELERRVRALLDGGRDRRPLNRAAACTMVAVLAVLLLPVAAITVRAEAHPVSAHSDLAPAPAEAPAQQPAPVLAGSGAISGMVQDPSGARIFNGAVTVKFADGSNEQRAITDELGTFQFPSLPVGQYTLQVSAPGFKNATLTALSVQASEALTANLRMELGGVKETVTITAARPTVSAAPAAKPAGAPQRVRVGGNVQAAALLRRVPPVYPEDLRAQGISGTVHLAAIIGKQGFITEIHSLGGPDPGLVAAAIEAASRWVYQPALLNGEPVMVETAIDITFELK